MTLTVQMDIAFIAVPLSKYDCSFESDFCNWTQEHVQDTFDWVRAQGPKGSAATGPVVDHSYGTGNIII